MKAKWCWVATQTRAGWRLKLCVGSRDFPVRGLLLDSVGDVSKVTRGAPGKVVYVHMRQT
jgi:hypothetical protein